MIISIIKLHSWNDRSQENKKKKPYDVLSIWNQNCGQQCLRKVCTHINVNHLPRIHWTTIQQEEALQTENLNKICMVRIGHSSRSFFIFSTVADAKNHSQGLYIIDYVLYRFQSTRLSMKPTKNYGTQKWSMMDFTKIPRFWRTHQKG